MQIELDAQLRLLIQKLANCQDSKTGERIFYGSVRVSYDDKGDGIARLFVEETTWDTESGDKIDTRFLRTSETTP